MRHHTEPAALRLIERDRAVSCMDRHQFAAAVQFAAHVVSLEAALGGHWDIHFDVSVAGVKV